MQVQLPIKQTIAVGLKKLVEGTGIFKSVTRGWPSPQILGNIDLPAAFILTADDMLAFDQVVDIAEHKGHYGVLCVYAKPDSAETLADLEALEDNLLIAEALVKAAVNEQQPGGSQLARWYTTKTPTEWAAISRGSIVPCFAVVWQESLIDPSQPGDLGD